MTWSPASSDGCRQRQPQMAVRVAALPSLVRVVAPAASARTPTGLAQRARITSGRASRSPTGTPPLLSTRRRPAGPTAEQPSLAAAPSVRAGRPPGRDDSRFGTIFATGVGGLRSTQEQIEVLIEKRERRVSPFVPMMMPNAAARPSPCATACAAPTRPSAACSSPTPSAGAARLIAWGMIDAASPAAASPPAAASAWPRSAT